ncbi:hypothetical protein AB0L70_26865 [Kribbella sp. NPDC051952]
MPSRDLDVDLRGVRVLPAAEVVGTLTDRPDSESALRDLLVRARLSH